MKKWIIVGAVTVLLLGLVGSGYLLLSRSGADPSDEDFIGTASDVSGEPVEVELGTVSSVLVLDAIVRAESGEKVRARQGGTVTHLWLNDGASVDKGAPVVNVSLPAEGGAVEGEDGEEDAPATREMTLYAPASGTLSGLDDVLVGDVLEPGATVATVSSGKFQAVAQVPANDLYRFYDDPGEIMLKIDKGPPAAECEFIGLGAGNDSSSEGDDETGGGEGGGSELSCRVPSDLTVFDGVQGKLSVSTGEAENVIVIPVTAVRGNSESGEVIVIGDDGSEEVREISLGLSDGNFLEVTEGLSVGEKVMDPIPLDPRFDIPEEPMDEFDEEFDEDFDEDFEDPEIAEES
ncbi:peptidase M23 [Nocardiopsis alba]|uniref:peptidase M23 n=1 Tax=Nocardiopsis alba TaxID=53437 RepID=UPI0033E95FE7